MYICVSQIVKINVQLAIVFLLLSCKNESKQNDDLLQIEKSKSSSDRVDTLKMKASKITLKPAIFETAFFEGTKANEDKNPINFYAVEIGEIKIESGKIIACDPIVMHDAKPFIQEFPIGEFPVQLAVAKIKDDERIAFSRILFSNKPVVKWEFALDTLIEQVPIDGEKFYGYGVDGGIGIFIDEKANKYFNGERKKDEGLWPLVFDDEMEKHSHVS